MDTVVNFPVSSHEKIMRAATAIRERLAQNARFNWETVFIVGDNLSRIRKECESADCGYEGRNPDMRYHAAVKSELCNARVRDISHDTLLRYRKVAEAFTGARREALIASDRSLRDVLAEIATPPANDQPAKTASKPANNQPKPAPPRVNVESIDNGSDTESGRNKVIDWLLAQTKSELVKIPVAQHAEIAERFGISERAVRDGIEHYQLAFRYWKKVEESKIDISILPKSAAQKLESLERRLRTQLETEYQERVYQEVKVKTRKWVDEHMEPWRKQIDFAIKWGETLGNGAYVPKLNAHWLRKYPFTKAEFMHLLKCLREDTRNTVTNADLHKASILLNAHRERLVAPEAPRGGVPLPPDRTSMEDFAVVKKERE